MTITTSQDNHASPAPARGGGITKSAGGADAARGSEREKNRAETPLICAETISAAIKPGRAGATG